MKGYTWRISLIFIFIIASCVYLTPTLVDTLPKWWSGLLPKDKIHLGLDLQGGTHLVMEVETQKAVEGSLDLIATDLEDSLTAQNVRFKKVARLGGDKVQLTLYDRGSADKVQALIKKKYPDLETLPVFDEGGFVNMQLRINEKEAQVRKDRAVAQALETIRNRIDQFGVSEPVIQREGLNNIVVQLPGIKDPKRAIELIGKTARLEFKLVDESVNAATATAGSLPEDDELLFEKRTDPQTGAVSETPLVVKKKAMITGELLTDAQIRIDSQYNQPYVAIEFNSTGARLFDQVTAANVGKRFAIVLDSNIYSAPVIRERISGGSAQISGSFTEKEAADLAIVLRAGSLPAPVKILQNVTVGPSLGRDSIHKGLMAGLIGVVLVVSFMAMYYKLSGMVANLGMVLNILFLMGALSALGATLTLPGIAAIVLLVGMSVDSNVLIFERIREELRLGKTPHAALDAGYDKAFLTIMDSHVTALITAAVLFQFGTGPVKGFAVSLSLGIIINLFTSLVATKVLFDAFLERVHVKRLSV
ncbi:protein translocase subunit SecD [Geomonas sp. Red69]|uniref:Protein translocase subunit SecD n=1 Tax=Geomonas diazotrophica TaxID=2843197 RepID=A0ABX8JND1_9BACT|nr:MULTISPECIES: protein translocase subunit SecD [Geomonas]MBU5636322.1 protein translocase subunit SecD [Geomonas diazotrophica]QWV99179.1 protein translocase subunit SecD [Geomonas nitrogeniifigens]QXE88348.1 protein translocase subunit SecD [Geomonas nitrogeniifigens]